jgi:DNA-binding response OmpR family regulator
MAVEGLAQFQAHQAAIRLIILDLQMPKVDAFTTLQWLRAIDSNVPIILFTAMDYAEVYRLLPQLPAVLILEKFCGRTVLLATIKQLIRG